jgi:hypothetical protein
MRQKLLFAKIAGQGEQKTPARLLSFLQGASPKDAEQFLAKLRNASTLPVLYFCEYLDYWSTGFLLEKLQSLATRFYWLFAPENHVFLYYFYPLDSEKITGVLDPFKSIARDAQEDMWFLQIFEQCLTSWEALVKGDSAHVLVRTVVGATLLDDEILSSVSCDLF